MENKQTLVETVYKDIYKIAVRLPNNPLKMLNAYLIKGAERSLLIDTGFNRAECQEDLLNGLATIDVPHTEIDVFITHLHADHSGLVGLFKQTSQNIYASKLDGASINGMRGPEFAANINKKLVLFDLIRDGVDYKDHPAHQYAATGPIAFTSVAAGDIINIGAYQLEVVDTAGHTPGLLGLYERSHQLYFSADHVLDQISPNITFWSFEFDALAVYLENLHKISQYKATHVFPSHRNVMHDHPRRAQELIAHHRVRIDEVYHLIQKPMSVRDIAALMSWRIRAKNWAAFPGAQKMFAAGEAMAHLEYLYNQGRLSREDREGILYYAQKLS